MNRTHPVAYWRLGEHVGLLAYSMDGNYIGTYRGAPRLDTTGLIQGSDNTAPHFDGTDDRITDNALTRQPRGFWSHGYSIVAWVRTTTTAVEEHIVTFNHFSGRANIAIFRDEPSNRFKFHDCDHPDCVSVLSKTKPVVGRIYQVAVTVNSNNRGHLYVDGKREASFVSHKTPLRFGRFTIGADYDYGPRVTSYWHGKIDEVAIYNRALTPTTMAALWAAGRDRKS